MQLENMGDNHVHQVIRPAESHEAELLSRIGLAAKRYWDYPDHYYEAWQPELTITAEYIEAHDVWVYEQSGKIYGYYSLVRMPEGFTVGEAELPAGIWLDHIFVLPEHMSKHIGRALFAHLVQRCKDCASAALYILSDPNAQGFYDRMGCIYLGEVPSSIPGRTTPLLKLVLEPEAPH